MTKIRPSLGRFTTSNSCFTEEGDPEFTSSATFPVNLQVSAAVERFDRPALVLLALPENSARFRLLQTLHGIGGIEVLEFDKSLVDGSGSLRPQEVDVAVVHAGHLNPNCAGLLHDPGFGFPELVFTIDDSCPTQRLALLSHGYRHVISDDRLATWLPNRLPSLCTLARARRNALEACSTKTAVADLILGKAASGRTNLHIAETANRARRRAFGWSTDQGCGVFHVAMPSNARAGHEREATGHERTDRIDADREAGINVQV